MPQMRDDGGGVDTGQISPSTSASHKVINTGNPDTDLSCAILALLDEINTLRTHVAIGLAAKTVTQIATAINAKKT